MVAPIGVTRSLCVSIPRDCPVVFFDYRQRARARGKKPIVGKNSSLARSTARQFPLSGLLSSNSRLRPGVSLSPTTPRIAQWRTRIPFLMEVWRRPRLHFRPSRSQAFLNSALLLLQFVVCLSRRLLLRRYPLGFNHLVLPRLAFLRLLLRPSQCFLSLTVVRARRNLLVRRPFHGRVPVLSSANERTSSTLGLSRSHPVWFLDSLRLALRQLNP